MGCLNHLFSNYLAKDSFRSMIEGHFSKVRLTCNSLLRALKHSDELKAESWHMLLQDPIVWKQNVVVLRTAE